LPNVGWSTRFFAVVELLVVSWPASGVIVSEPLPTARFAFCRTTVHFGSSALPSNSSLVAAGAKFTV
jgi:hypothetical protein